MAKSVKSRRGRFVSGLVLVGALVGLGIVLQSAAEQRSWASAEATVLERIKSGKSASVKIEYSLPDGSKQVQTLSENGSKHEQGTRVTVRYDLRDGRVVDSALADNDQVFWVLGVMLSVVALGSIGMNLIAWTRGRRPE
ncbi:hypothetical protein SK854_41440 [Lentzea sp. BCCO 10_0061]|uniref:DUF3592 domain-containing protein n=1 Tax=Lentzea sokolovensis TaxID=3095429 RepID=A0ABU4VBS7_9PSEU|nr:DUF3592 domain-containing protein [Lentzea sp. BCCO 10_0061]MDX8148639.1 hypothetical protein [Lentzea sp. BCCO 10_0061]